MAHMSTQNPELQGRLGQGLAKIALVIRRGQRAATGPRRLSPTQAQILAVVAAEGGRGRGLGGIADWLGLIAATASRAVSRLEDKGLLSKQRAADDRRNIRVFLTAEGGRQARRVWFGESCGPFPANPVEPVGGGRSVVRGAHAHGAHGIAARLGDLHGVVIERDAITGLGDRLHRFEDQAVDGAGPGGG